MTQVDMKKLDILKGVGEKLGQDNYVSQMLQNFYADGQKNLGELATVQGDLERYDFAADTIHRFNGSCGFFGAVGLQKKCRAMEQMLREKRLDPDSAEFKKSIQTLVKELDAFYVKASSSVQNS